MQQVYVAQLCLAQHAIEKASVPVSMMIYISVTKGQTDRCGIWNGYLDRKSSPNLLYTGLDKPTFMEPTQLLSFMFILYAALIM